MTILARRRRRRAPGARCVGAGGRAGAPRADRPSGREPRRADAGRPRGATREGPRRPAAQVRGSNKLVLEEADRSLHDALCVVRSLVKEKFLVAGGGSAEVEASLGLADAAAREPGPVGFCLRAFADALEVVPCAKINHCLGGPGQTSNLSSSVKSKSIRPSFGRIDCRVLEAQKKATRRNCQIRSN